MYRERGKLLTVMLILGILGLFSSLHGLLTNPTESWKSIYENISSWFKLYILLGDIAVGTSILGIWLWKKWAVYLFVTFVLIGVFINLLILKPILFIYPATFLGVSLWFLAIYRKWRYFE